MRLIRSSARCPVDHCPVSSQRAGSVAFGRRAAGARGGFTVCSGHGVTATTWTCDLMATQRRSVRRRVSLLTELVVLVLLASESVARADTTVLAIVGSIDEVLTNIRNWLMGILAGLATVCLTIGGIRRVFGGGDPGEQEKAKESFKAAGIGYGLAALAPLIVSVLKGIVGA